MVVVVAILVVVTTLFSHDHLLLIRFNNLHNHNHKLKKTKNFILQCRRRKIHTIHKALSEKHTVRARVRVTPRSWARVRLRMIVPTLVLVSREWDRERVWHWDLDDCEREWDREWQWFQHRESESESDNGFEVARSVRETSEMPEAQKIL